MFISHAGEQKGSFAAFLLDEMTRCGVKAFLDEKSLQLGEAADVRMEAALRSCRVVVAVLTPAFLRSSYCMEELHWALHPKEAHPPLQQKFSSRGADNVANDIQRAAAQLPQPGEPCTVQRAGSRLPTLIPVFHETSDIEQLQKHLKERVERAEAVRKSARAAARPAPASAAATAALAAAASAYAAVRRADDNVAAACRHVGDRKDSHGK